MQKMNYGYGGPNMKNGGSNAGAKALMAALKAKGIKKFGGACGPTQWKRNLNGGSRRAL